MEPQTAARYRLLDELRGLDLISMMLYHGMWDVVFLFGVAQKWYTGRPGFVWQQSICWVFILLSGFCLPLGHHPFRRGAVVFGAGALVTAVTLLFLPEDVVWFGVLTLLGSSMLLTAALDPLLRRVPPAVGVAVSALLFWVTYPTMNGFWNLPGGRLALPQALYASYTTAYLGFMPKSFFSTDYFPLLPWLVSVLGGVLPPPPRGPRTPRAAAQVGLPAAGLDGPSLAGALSAPSAGHPGGADGGVPAGESGVKLLEKLASVTA